MNERDLKRPAEIYDEYGAFKQHDLVDGINEGRLFTNGEIKSFTKWLDSGETVANITPTDRSTGFSGDIHVDPSQLRLKLRLGKQRKVNLGSAK